jgi:phosphatidylglycerol---prolipoprotein diacylglyceryl transferase
VVGMVEAAQRLTPRAEHLPRGCTGGLRQVLFEWRGIKIHSYLVMVYLGLTVGLVAGNAMANLAGLPAGRVLVALMLLTVPGLVGARLLFVAANWSVYRREPWRIWRRSEGGAAVQGGVVLSVAVSPPLLTALQIPFGAFWDVATFVMLIWLIFGRFGCLLHGCCSGRPTDGRFALYLPDQRGVWRRRIPTQLLEAGWAALILLGASGLWNERPFPGAIFLAAVTVYACGRFMLEPMREHRGRIGALHLQRVLAAAVGTLALAGSLIAWLGFGPDP